MGRPPLKVKPTAVRLSPEVMAKIDDLEGPGRRAQFIRAAVDEAIRRRDPEWEPENDG